MGIIKYKITELFPQTVSRFATKHPPAFSHELCFGCRTVKLPALPRKRMTTQHVEALEDQHNEPSDH